MTGPTADAVLTPYPLISSYGSQRMLGEIKGEMSNSALRGNVRRPSKVARATGLEYRV